MRLLRLVLGVLSMLIVPCAFASTSSSCIASSSPPQVVLNTTSVRSGADAVEVTWALPRGQKDDFLAVLPEGATLPSTSPAKIYVTNGACGGNITLRLVGVRTPFVVSLYRGGLSAPQLLASSTQLLPAYPNEPTGVHLMLSSPTSMSVTWTTLNETAPAVFWSTNKSAFQQANGTTTTLLRSSLPGDARVWWTPTRPLELASNATEIGWLDPGKQHSATMTGLPPGERVWYAVGRSDINVSAADVRSFVQPPSGENTSFTMIVAADMGVGAEADGSNFDPSGCACAMP